MRVGTVVSQASQTLMLSGAVDVLDWRGEVVVARVFRRGDFGEKLWNIPASKEAGYSKRHHGETSRQSRHLRISTAMLTQRRRTLSNRAVRRGEMIDAKYWVFALLK
jgi:hypothetical protein